MTLHIDTVYCIKVNNILRKKYHIATSVSLSGIVAYRLRLRSANEGSTHIIMFINNYLGLFR